MNDKKGEHQGEYKKNDYRKGDCKNGDLCCKAQKSVYAQQYATIQKDAYLSLPKRMGRVHDLPRSVKILDIRNENPFVKTFTLDVSVGAEPGQFVMLWLPRVDEKPFSVAFDDGKTLQLAIAKVGSFTEELFKKSVGDLVGVRGPYGKPFEYADGEHLAVVGGGYGAAPLYFLAHQAVAKGCTVEFIVGARSAEYLLFVERTKRLKGVTVHVATDDGSAGFKGYNATLLGDFLGKKWAKAVAKIDRILTVGPEKMMKAVSDLALQHDVPCQVSVERYMKCGFGICGQCVIDDSGMATCMEGPVMDHQVARRQSEFGMYHRNRMGKKMAW